MNRRVYSTEFKKHVLPRLHKEAIEGDLDDGKELLMVEAEVEVNLEPFCSAVMFL